jgi:hypothetical protein
MLTTMNHPPELQPVLFFSTIILWWAWARPSMMRDYDGRRLPQNTMARSIFMLFYLVVFAMTLAAFELFEGFGPWFAKNFSFNFAGKLFDSVNNQGPLLSCIAIGGLLQVPFFRELERSVLVWLHSARHLHQDSERIAAHLMNNVFAPSGDEIAKNIATAGTHGVYVTDGGLRNLQGARLLAVTNWRKVATLLRVLNQWNDGEHRTLSQADMEQLDEIETAHDRKTVLAMTIIKMVDRAERGGSASAAISELLAALSNTQHIDRANVAAVETRIKGMAFDETVAGEDRPLRLTGEQLTSYLIQIEAYFKVEYELLLQQVAHLTAKSIMLSGQQAPDRLEHLKSLGFEGFGRIELINFDRVLWMFLFVAVAGFLVLVLGNGNMTQQQMEGTARFTFAMAFASLIGAIVGSRRRHATGTDTPWGSYFAAGLVAGALYVGIQTAYALLRSLLPDGTGNLDSAVLARALPWALLPAFVTIAICRLARLPQWPVPSALVQGPAPWPGVWSRVLDGLCVSAALLIAYVLAIEIILMTDPKLLPTRIAAAMDSGKLRLPIPILLPLQLMGFLIGYAVVTDVRRSAHSRVISPQQTRRAAATLGQPVTAGT